MGSQHPSGTAELQWVPISVLFFFPDLGDWTLFLAYAMKVLYHLSYA
jgi:hypothetical protein